MPDKTKSSSKSKTAKQVVAKTKVSQKPAKRIEGAKPASSSITIKPGATRAKASVKTQKESQKARTVSSESRGASAPSKGGTTSKNRASSAVKHGETKGAQELLVLSQVRKAQLDEILAELARRDRKLKALMPKVEGGFVLKTQETDSPFAAIAEAIVYQQLTGKAAATIFGRVKALFKSDLCPTPEQIKSAPDTVLRSAGLSRAKVVALKDLADKTISGSIPTMDEISRMTDNEIITCLSAVKGVGVWTAHMFLIFRLGRLDVMPSGDYGVKKGFALTYGDGETLPSQRELERFAEIWKPYRTVGSWFMWRAIELGKKSR